MKYLAHNLSCSFHLINLLPTKHWGILRGWESTFIVAHDERHFLTLNTRVIRHYHKRIQLTDMEIV